MKERILIVLVVLATATLAFLPLSGAFANLTVYGYTDKSYYRPGDSGTLRFWIYNSGTDDLILKNVSIFYPWYNPVGLWEGNVTIVPSTDTVIVAGGNWSGTSSFTVPNDGRANGGSISITVVTDKTARSSSIPMSLSTVPFYFSLQSMDQLVTLLMVLVIVVAVCLLAIAGVVFLYTRRRQMWKTDEKLPPP